MKAKIKIKNGYWTFNGVPVKDCSFPIQKVVAAYIKQCIFDVEPEAKPDRCRDKKELLLESSLYNYKFEKLNN